MAAQRRKVPGQNLRRDAELRRQRLLVIGNGEAGAASGFARLLDQPVGQTLEARAEFQVAHLLDQRARHAPAAAPLARIARPVLMWMPCKQGMST